MTEQIDYSKVIVINYKTSGTQAINTNGLPINIINFNDNSKSTVQLPYYSTNSQALQAGLVFNDLYMSGDFTISTVNPVNLDFNLSSKYSYLWRLI